MRRRLVILASLAIVFALVRATGFRTIAGVWRTVDPRAVAVVVACWYGSLALRIASWRILLGEGAPPARTLASPLALGFVLSYAAPAKTGEPMPALLASRASGLPFATTLSVLTAERAAHLLLLLATFVPAAAFTAGAALPLARAARAASLGLAALAAASPFAPALLRRAGRAAARVRRGGPAVAAYCDALADLLGSPRRVTALLALSAAFWALQYFSLWAILRGGGAPVNPLEAATVAGCAILGGTLSLLPLGTQDGISALALRAFGVPLARGFSLALFHTTLSLGCGALLALAIAAAGAARRPARTAGS
ncbi:MAG: lysylphosphatidylglycerol synthase transmembrane domain-containing protein [bacterium]